MKRSFAIHESKHSDKVVKFCTDLTKYCSKKQSNKIHNADENGFLYGVYFTKSGKIKATYI